ncbi:hypothetical protein [Algoriphagus confluentis]|uniref:Uncharacterized protein n=1 Tax=Algoriphagus confluentis TaxID=1697556 RepID=A0ABQ6PR97_9BACT|nr:hypothetical protein Aconfl_24280 [Algoriphagus confluentis]
MKKLLSGLTLFVVGCLLLVSCNQEDDFAPQLKEGQVALNLVNVLSSSSPIGARLSQYTPYGSTNPFCSSEQEVTVEFEGTDDAVRITFINKLVNAQGGLIGYKWRARNGTANDLTNVQVRVGGNTPIWTTSVLGAGKEVFFLTPGPAAGVSIFWDGGSRGTASSNETTVVACNYNPTQPNCENEQFIFVSATRSNVSFSFQGSLFQDVNDANSFLGFKFRIENPTSFDWENVRITGGGGFNYPLPNVPAGTDLWVLMNEPGQSGNGMTLRYDQVGGAVNQSRGTATPSINNQKRAVCSGDPCEFVPFTHVAPAIFDVYFVPTNGGPTVKVENHNYLTPLVVSIPLQEYTVYVTNYDDGDANTLDDYNNLPDYSSVLYMVGSAVIDYGSVSTANVTALNPYSAILVANNYQLDGIPNLDGQPLVQSGDAQYFYIYSKVDGNETVGILDIRGDSQDQGPQDFVANQQYRFLLCLDSELIILREDVFSVSNDVIIR